MRQDYVLIFAGFLLCMLLFSCSFTKEEKERDNLGKYVYMDSQQILHTRKHCIGLCIDSSEDEIGSYKPIEFIDTAKVTRDMLKSMCSWCVEDNHYEQLRQIAERHKKSLNWGRNHDSETDW